MGNAGHKVHLQRCQSTRPLAGKNDQGHGERQQDEDSETEHQMPAAQAADCCFHRSSLMPNYNLPSAVSGSVLQGLNPYQSIKAESALIVRLYRVLADRTVDNAEYRRAGRGSA